MGRVSQIIGERLGRQFAEQTEEVAIQVVVELSSLAKHVVMNSL